MKNKIWGFCGAVLSALFLCPNVQAIAGGQLIYDNYMPVPASSAYSSTFSIRADGIDWAAAQVVVTSVTALAQTVTDGSASTGSFTITSFAALSTAPATGKITVTSDSSLAGTCISGGGLGLGAFQVCNPGQFAVTGTTATDLTAVSQAINAAYGATISTYTANGTVIFTTAAAPGTAWNAFQINAAAAVGTVTQMSGGQNNATVTVNGQIFTANSNWYPATSNAATATSLATAITNSSNTIGVTATGSQGVVSTTSTIVGASTAYSLAVSSWPTIGLSGPVLQAGSGASSVMTGGTNAAFTVGQSSIAIGSGSNFGTGLQVLYTTGTATVTIVPLVWGTTYYVISLPGTSTVIDLATSLANAKAGTPIVFTSSATATTADNFTLTPLSITGTPAVSWSASNDNVHWIPFATTPFNVTLPVMGFGTYFSTGTVANYDFGHYDYGYIGLNVTAPTTGALNILAHVVGNAP